MIELVAALGRSRAESVGGVLCVDLLSERVIPRFIAQNWKLGFAVTTPMFYTPEEAYLLFRQRREQMSAERFFNDPDASTLRDIWLAAHFGHAYSQAFTPCRLLLDESRKHDWDFILAVDGMHHPFQATEAQQPGRRRGLEYRELASGSRPSVVSESWEPGTVNGPNWIKDAIELKRQKHYSGESELNLLVYANFTAYQLEFSRVQAVCQPFAQAFHSAWVITGKLLCTLESRNSGLGMLPVGWLVFDQLSNESET